ncbi:hypothetical protein [Streptomyces sp. MUM 2J]|uniref:hypothetical protein n=1 Tax=Streptomyces sp. MUM 2J TaxID=2791987 RepID=UPI001F035BE8|nr:hypothetical protein [Streptomyces sp. MUM 2J]MCH0567530.1 V-type ATPase subunit [Streptomyces sp. MUM 2J]
MGARWAAGVTRARAMAAGRAGAEAARRMADGPALEDSLRALAGTPYRRDLDVRAEAGAAARAVTASLVWQLRVLAGWQPRPGAAAVRLLASRFEIDNTRDHLRALDGTPQPPPLRLGALSTAWPRLSRATSAAQVRAVLAASVWGDPGGEGAAAVLTGMRLSAAARTAANVPSAARWAAGEAALLVAREVFVSGRVPTPAASVHASRLLGRAAVHASDYDGFRRRLPSAARWALASADRPEELWRAEARWWTQVERDGLRLLHGAGLDLSPVVGATAVLSADAWRVRAALECAAHGGRAREAFDELLD